MVGLEDEVDSRTVRQEERLTGVQQDRNISGQVNRKRDRQVTRWAVRQEDRLEEHIERWTERQMNWNRCVERHGWEDREEGQEDRKTNK